MKVAANGHPVNNENMTILFLYLQWFYPCRRQLRRQSGNLLDSRPVETVRAADSRKLNNRSILFSIIEFNKRKLYCHVQSLFAVLVFLSSCRFPFSHDFIT